MVTYDNVKIISTKTDKDYWDEDKRKHIKYKTPKTTTKTLFENNIFELGELYTAIKFSLEQEPYDKVSVAFDVKQEY